MFKKLVESAGGHLTGNFDLNTLAHITERYPAGSFKYVINKVLTERRISKLDKKPLTLNEFIGPLSASY